MTAGAWSGDWVARVFDRVRGRGYESLMEFAASLPCAPFGELADQLGHDVAAAQVERLLLLEASRTGRVNELARNNLVREIHHSLPSGWGRGDAFDSSLSAALAVWATTIEGISNRCLDSMWEFFHTIEMPDGWLPSGPDDPVLKRAFAGMRFDAPAGE